MTAREFLTNAAILSTIMAVAALIEAAVPMFSRHSWTRGRRAANLGLTSVVFLLNWSLSSAAAVLALGLSLQPPALARGLQLPMVVQIIVGVLILDFSAGYLAHRALHFVPVLWRFHQIHHSDDFVDVTTTYRTHPVETVWRFLFIFVPVWLIGIPALAVVIQRLVSAANGILEHGNIRLWRPLDRMLSLVWVTPNIHKIHHSRQRAETNSNYGNVPDAVRPAPRHVHAKRASRIGRLRSGRGGSGTDRVVCGAPVHAVSTAGTAAFPDTKVRIGSDVSR